MSQKILKLTLGVAGLAMAAMLWSLPVAAGSPAAPRGSPCGLERAWTSTGRAGVANPRPARDDDDSDDSDGASGDATPWPDPGPADVRA